MERIKYTIEERIALVAQVQELSRSEGISLKQACDKLQLRPDNYYRWARGEGIDHTKSHRAIRIAAQEPKRKYKSKVIQPTALMTVEIPPEAPKAEPFSLVIFGPPALVQAALAQCRSV